MRSWLFAPGHNSRILAKAFDAGADAVLLDLEDGVPSHLKEQARDQVDAVLDEHPGAWVRVNRPGSAISEADLAMLAGRSAGIRLPKTESLDDVRWVAQRAPDVALACTVETAKGIVNALAIAEHPQVKYLVLGQADLAADLRVAPNHEAMLLARSGLVVAARAAGKEGPIDSAFLGIRDGAGLRSEAEIARRLGFSGKSAIHPHQVPIINAVFSPTEAEIRWSRAVVEKFEESGGVPTTLEDGTFIDAPVVSRARHILSLLA
jgi:citrate lyase subunit beta/citryl-CoA lyase